MIAVQRMERVSNLLFRIVSPIHPICKKAHNPSITKVGIWIFSAVYAFSENTRQMIYKDIRVQTPSFLPLTILITLLGTALILRRMAEGEKQRLANEQ